MLRIYRIFLSIIALPICYDPAVKCYPYPINNIRIQLTYHQFAINPVSIYLSLHHRAIDLLSICYHSRFLCYQYAINIISNCYENHLQILQILVTLFNFYRCFIKLLPIHAIIGLRPPCHILTICYQSDINVLSICYRYAINILPFCY